MLFSESWLRTYVNPAISSEELQDALTMHGLEVDEARKAAPDFTGVVIAEVVECRDHENSDHLHVCQVNARHWRTDPDRLRRAERPSWGACALRDGGS